MRTAHVCDFGLVEPAEQIGHLHLLGERHDEVAIHLHYHLGVHLEVPLIGVCCSLPNLLPIRRGLQPNPFEQFVFDGLVGEELHEPLVVALLDELPVGGVRLELGLGHKLAVVDTLGQRLQGADVRHGRRTILAVFLLSADLWQQHRGVVLLDPLVDVYPVRLEQLPVRPPRQQRRRECLGKEGVLVGAVVPPQPRVQLLGLHEEEVQKALRELVGQAAGLVHRGVVGELCAFDECEDNGLLLPDEISPDVAELEAR
mmetsp:Transcript_5296/g.14589  ORF Transcript_5296/g.14589 Transcript_5296/m.14589 type:complete len:257 (-) Transcript_5296:196-966(-)